ncbi:MAG: thiolase family protein, partial [Syntrophomonadaceae bacterium]|nr:thiolase family protein [Syntrophomonadaceae bacterium]
DGLYDGMVPGHMGITAENIAEQYGITREECDQLAVMSHQRATRAVQEGIFKREIIPIEIKSKKGVLLYETDEHMIPDANLETMAKLPSAFKKGGVVTAANASGINDAAAAVVVMSKQKAKELGITPLMKMLTISAEGVDPKVMGLGPAVAIPKALKIAGLKFEDIEYWEINEAFASQFLGVGLMLQQDFGINLDMDKCNLNGSGIALGHPVGCTALRIVVSLYYEMERLGLTLGGASLCVGGGPALACLWTREI